MATLTFSGGKALAANLDKLSKRLSRVIQLEALKEVAEPMRRSMAQKAPVDTGKLKTQMVVNNSRGQDAQEAAVAVGPARGGFYGSFHEFGSKQIQAKPFMRPAFDETAPKALQDLGDVLWRELAGRGLHRPMENIDVPVQGEEP